jgi:pSer/pThr/pTyr-binding forkhead associated (FHA) protein
MGKVVFKLPHGKTFGNINNLPRLCVVGRSLDCDLAAPEPSVSRNHLTFRVDDDGALLVSDNRSKNGTFLNGERLDGERGIAPGLDRLTLCGADRSAPLVKFEPMEAEDDVQGFALTFVEKPKK